MTRILFLGVIIVLNLFFSEETFTQCPTGDITLTSQNQVNNFPQNYPNCHRLSGSLTINATNATNLDSLQQIDTIDLGLTMYDNTQLLNLSGLKNLTSIQDFVLSGSPLIKNLIGLDSLKIATNSLGVGQMSGLESLKGIQAEYIRQFTIIDCPKLTDLTGLDKLGRTGTFNVLRNENLVSLNGINPHLGFGDHFRVDSNPKLIALANFENMAFVYNLAIVNNPLLKNIEGLKNLGGAYYLSIINNPSLEDLDDLVNLKSIDIELTIVNNAKLMSMEGLTNLNGSLLDSITIINNPKLSLCSAKGICDFLKAEGGYNVSNNDAACSTKPNILTQCAITPTLVKKETAITFFPNPASDFLYLEGLQGIEKLTLYHVSGSLIRNIPVNGDQLTLPVHDLAEGLYILKASGASMGDSKTIKVLVQHSK